MVHLLEIEFETENVQFVALIEYSLEVWTEEDASGGVFSEYAFNFEDWTILSEEGTECYLAFENITGRSVFYDFLMELTDFKAWKKDQYAKQLDEWREDDGAWKFESAEWTLNNPIPE